MQREDERLKIYKKGKSPPLIYLYSNIKYVAVNNGELIFSPKKQDKK